MNTCDICRAYYYDFEGEHLCPPKWAIADDFDERYLDKDLIVESDFKFVYAASPQEAARKHFEENTDYYEPSDGDIYSLAVIEELPDDGIWLASDYKVVEVTAEVILSVSARVI